MAKNVFERLIDKLDDLPKKVETAFIDSTKKAINEEGAALKKNLERGSQKAVFIPDIVDIKKDKWEMAKQKLQDTIYSVIHETATSYTYEVDWDDKKIVDEDIGVIWGKNVKVSRRKGARNYSRAPATYHDLAYIISEGRAVNFSQNNVKVVQGTKFIEKAMRRAKKWKNKRDVYFAAELDTLGFNEDSQK